MKVPQMPRIRPLVTKVTTGVTGNREPSCIFVEGNSTNTHYIRIGTITLQRIYKKGSLFQSPLWDPNHKWVFMALVVFISDNSRDFVRDKNPSEMKRFYTQQKFAKLSLIQKHNDQNRQPNSTHQHVLTRSNVTLKSSSNQLQLTSNLDAINSCSII
jgi:hypothetical protein